MNRLDRWLCFVVSATCACGAEPPPPVSSDAYLPQVAFVDVNPDPKIVEVNVVAEPGSTQYLTGKTTQIWGYRDASVAGSVPSVPGPLLEAREGDQVIVHFRNQLPEETTIHWHGMRLPPQADGTPSTQVPVLPGDEFEYRFTVRDASSFWYHPHVRAYDQVERGLYGPIIVRAENELQVSADRYFMLDDVKLDASGELNRDTTDLDRMMGRQGNVLLVSGRRVPVELEVNANSRERWRFVNTANGRYFNLKLMDGQATMLAIASDGGLLPEPVAVDTLLIAPGERYDVLVTFGPTATSGSLATVFYDRGHDLPDTGPTPLLHWHSAGTASEPAPLPDRWGEPAFLPTDDKTQVRPFVLEELEQPGLPPQFSINGERWPDSKPVHVQADDIEIWEIRNQSPMDHPFHLHGMFFHVTSGPASVMSLLAGWKDTVNVPQQSTLRFAVQYGPPGMWMFHCHILEHAELGMMGDLMVMP